MNKTVEIQEMSIGDIVFYKGLRHYVIGKLWHSMVEIAPTKHGAGSILVHVDYLEMMEE